MKTDWSKGDIISYAGEKYEVVENYGYTGKVKEHPYPGTVFEFYWRYEGEDCVLIEKCDEGAGCLKAVEDFEREVKALLASRVSGSINKQLYQVTIPSKGRLWYEVHSHGKMMYMGPIIGQLIDLYNGL